MDLEGIAELPLHSGRVPPWLAVIMKRLAKAILEVMVLEYGSEKVVERFSNPLWFQAFNNVIGMDWDSSGSTTVTTGILKEVTWSSPELGVLVLGGKGVRARRVPLEIPVASEILGLDTRTCRELEKASRLIAKIDSSMLQDNYTLYHHTLLVSESGFWTIVQQGMNIEKKLARRYHWRRGTSFYSDPHEAISGYKHDLVLNLVASESSGVRKTILDIVCSKPESVVSDYARIYNVVKKQKPIVDYITSTSTGLVEYRSSLEKRLVVYKPLPLPKELLSKLKKLYEVYPRDLDELLLVRGVSAKTLRALTLISDLVYNEPPSTRDPVNTPYDPFIYAYAIGGKDGIPYPVRRRDAEEVIVTLEDIVREARIGGRERLLALKRLSKLRTYFIK